MAPSKKKPAPKPILRQDWKIGSASAEYDEAFLDSCFVDTGALGELLSTDSNKSIVLGRVGAGKSALIREIEKREHHVRRIRPQEFSLRYISNSDVLQFVSALGIKLDPVFQALWKHVLCVELLKLRYNITSPEDSRTHWNRLGAIVTLNDTKRRALDYFSKFGGTDFWQTTEVRIREITTRLETGLEGSLGIKVPPADSRSAYLERMTTEEKQQLVSNVRKFLDTIHMSALQDVVALLAHDEFGKSKHKYYIVVDDLDEQWAEDELRYRLIRALIEAIKRFREVRCVKVIIALRTDLLASVLEATRDSGFQEEKFEDFFLRLKWADTQLKMLVSQRVSELARSKYTSKTVAFYDIFPRHVRKLDTLEYIVKRTLKRPRDMILFLNDCFEEASGRTDITPTVIQTAELKYSNGRLDSLAQEWFSFYPQLKVHIDFLKGLKSRLLLSEIPIKAINDYIMSLYRFEGKSDDEVTNSGLRMFHLGGVESAGQALPLLRTLIPVLYRVGVVGIKRPNQGRFIFTDQPGASALAETIEPEYAIAVHPMMFAALETRVGPETD